MERPKKNWLMAIEMAWMAIRIRWNRVVIKQIIKKGGPYTSYRLVTLDYKNAQLSHKVYRLLEIWENVSPLAQVTDFPVMEELAQEKRSA